VPSKAPPLTEVVGIISKTVATQPSGYNRNKGGKNAGANPFV
jgi:hypothetical protein